MSVYAPMCPQNAYAAHSQRDLYKTLLEQRISNSIVTNATVAIVEFPKVTDIAKK